MVQTYPTRRHRGLSVRSFAMSTVYDLSFAQLAERLGTWGEPAFRAKQVWSQLWKRAATYDAMSDVAPALRERLAAELPLGVEVLDERTADRGGTRKALLKLGGTHVIEAVLMGYRDRVTVCVSSQAGCAMGCTFCATGQMGLKNNLTAGEIAAQVVWARREARRLPGTTPQRLGERRLHGDGGAARERTPRLRVAREADRPGRLRDGRASCHGVHRGDRRASDRLAAAHPQVGLAVSFHAASDELRDQLVPPNRRYPLAALEEAIAAWRSATRRRPSIEWALIDHVNDTVEQAELWRRSPDASTHT